MKKEELAKELSESNLLITQQIWFHLVVNHHPPVPGSMVDTCVQAIDLANQGKWDEPVELPEGVTYMDETHAPVWLIIEEHHLDAWIVKGKL
jgi:hypothetical protein